MADVKWIKITTDMFDNRKIKHLRKLPDGNNIVLIWVMLLTMAGRCNSNGMIFLTENIPYTPKMLADELDFEESTVQLALKALEQFNMIVTNGDFFTIAGWGEYQNTDGMEKIREQNRARVARHREKQKLLSENGANCNVTSNVTVTHCNALDKDKELEEELRKKEEELKKEKAEAEIQTEFETLWKMYPRKLGKPKALKAYIKARKNGTTYEQVEQGIKNYLAEIKAKKTAAEYIKHGSTWFNGECWNDEYNTTVSTTSQYQQPKQSETDDFMAKLKSMYHAN